MFVLADDALARLLLKRQVVAQQTGLMKRQIVALRQAASLASSFGRLWLAQI